jgi:Cd2+/Zn2+-exporting ATPase
MGYRVVPDERWSFRLEGLDCADCATRLETSIARIPGVISAQLNFATARLAVHGDGRPGLMEALRRRAGEHSVTLLREGIEEVADRGWLELLRRRSRDVLTGLAGLCIALGFGFQLMGLPAALSQGLYTLAILVGGFYVIRAGLATLLLARSADMNLLMTVASVGAMTIGEWEEGAIAMFLFSLGNALEAHSVDRARGAIRSLMTLSPQETTRIVGEKDERIPVSELEVGDLIRVRPGERIPTDGMVIHGTSAVDQSLITGESVPVDKAGGDEVYAGSLNGPNGLVIRATRGPKDNTLARIIQMVEEAQAQKAPSQRFVDTFARYYTPAMMMAAALTILVPTALGGDFHTWFYRGLVILVIGCPCALVLSTPVSIVSAIAAAARQGVLIKGGVYLEEAARLRAVALDKTGTLTVGRPSVTEVIPLNGRSREEVLAAAAAIEGNSEHPLARALTEAANAEGVSYRVGEEFRAVTGQGARARVDGSVVYVGSHKLFEALGNHSSDVCDRVELLESQGNTAVMVGGEGEIMGILAVADEIRREAAAAVSDMKKAGVRHTVILTGDNRPVAQAIGQAAGVDEVRAEVLPQDKVSAVRELLSGYGKVGMVGDGVNDAPALAAATVGIAMGAAGTDVAFETADVVLMSEDLGRVAWFIRLSRRTLAVIRQNITFSLVVKGLFFLLALGGLSTLWMAIFADMGTSLIVIFNGLRLLRIHRDS